MDRTKIVYLGTLPYLKTSMKVFAKIEWDGKRLSISGVEGPMKSGNCRGSCGQIIIGFKEFDARGYCSIQDITPAKGWTHGLIHLFFTVWDRWHMNDSKAGCWHQRLMGWDKEPIDPSKPTTAYGKFYPGQPTDSWNSKGWVYPPHGHLTEACPACGYKYGTKWLHEDVPAKVIDFLFNLPDADITPAWI